MVNVSPSKDNLEFLTKAVALGASLSLAASVIYDWGFLYALNLSFLDIPSGIADHVRSALLWFPSVIGIFAAFMFGFISTGYFGQERSSDGAVVFKPVSKLTRSTELVMTVVAVSVIVVWFLFGGYTVLMLAFSIGALWLFFSEWLYRHAKYKEKITWRRWFVFTTVPPFMFWMFLQGYTDAMFTYQKKSYGTQLDITETSQPVDVRVLRQLEKGMLVLNDQNKVVFYPWGDIKKINSPGYFEPPKGFLCSQFSIACRDLTGANQQKQGGKGATE